MKSYIVDNYTWLGFWLGIIGLVFALIMFRKMFSAQFITAFSIGGLVWVFIMGYKLGGHSYHQYPIAPLIILGITFISVLVADTLKGLTRIPIVSWIVLAAAFALLFNPSLVAANRQFDTQFWGLEQAGEYIRERSTPKERILHSSHQSYGVHWHADRKGRGLPSTVEALQAEEAAGARWILIYQWAFPNVLGNEPLWTYIKSNYAARQFAVLPRGSEQAIPVYLLLEKGGNFTDETLQKAQGIQRQVTYELTSGTVPLFVIDYV